jgi:hypothetical protein
MTSVIIGICSGFLIILLFSVLKHFDKGVIYGQILTGIGFLYVGFSGTDQQALMVNSAQAIYFVFFAYFGIKKSLCIFAAGCFLHRTWDLAYDLFPKSNLIPSNYDLFCLSIDFTIGFYILLFNYFIVKKTGQLTTGIKS